MTLGRTSAGKIKIKTDGGLRAVECGCCGPCGGCEFPLSSILVTVSYAGRVKSETIQIPEGHCNFGAVVQFDRIPCKGDWGFHARLFFELWGSGSGECALKVFLNPGEYYADYLECPPEELSGKLLESKTWTQLESAILSIEECSECGENCFPFMTSDGEGGGYMAECMCGWQAEEQNVTVTFS